MEPIGLYIHVPFCTQKCPYCDFYSLTDTKQMNDYTNCIINRLYTYRKAVDRDADTLYFGGGTPSTLGANRLCSIIDVAKNCFGLERAEITVEVNPSGQLEALLDALAQKGVNRISIGMQSAHAEELDLLGRKHTAKQAEMAVMAAHRAGIANVSMDLMVGIQKQTEQSLKESIAFCHNAGASHISAYLLKVEPNTPYGKQQNTLILLDDDQMGDFYLCMVDELERRGYHQYEISNFAQKDANGVLQISKHNTKYWQGKEYLGIGPSAHSFLKGERFYYDRNLYSFLKGNPPIMDGQGGDKEEFIMLALRLTDGLTNEIWYHKFQEPLPQSYIKRAQRYEAAGLVHMKKNGFALTPKGFLVSNQLILSIIGA